jgi:hypothetical protein
MALYRFAAADLATFVSFTGSTTGAVVVQVLLAP